MTSKHSVLWAAVVFAASIVVTFGCGDPSTRSSNSECRGGAASRAGSGVETACP